MALPSSGQISLNDFRTEFGQTGVAPYSFDYASTGWSPPDSPGQFYAPVNVGVGNDGKFYTTDTAMYNDHFTNWYGYNHNAFNPVGSTPQPLFLNVLPYSHCNNSSMIIFSMGTSDKTVNIRISGSANNLTYGLIESVWIYYGKPWSSVGWDRPHYDPAFPWGAEVIYSASYYGTPGGDWFTNGFDVNFNYNYVYNSASGSKLYAVVYSYCP